MQSMHVNINDHHTPITLHFELFISLNKARELIDRLRRRELYKFVIEETLGYEVISSSYELSYCIMQS